MLFAEHPRPTTLGMLRDLEVRPFWLDDPSRPSPHAALAGDHTADLVVVGGGFTGLWTALLAKQQSPKRDVVLVDADRVAGAATGRNGGFLHASLTHGTANGLARYADELPMLMRLGVENLHAIEAFVRERNIECDWRASGELEVAFEPHQLETLLEAAVAIRGAGERVDVLDASELQQRVRLAGAVGGTHDVDGIVMVNPARLAWGLLDACRDAGVRVYEHSAVRRMRRSQLGVRLEFDAATIDAAGVVLATNAAPSLLPAVRRRIVPVYDYALVTEPLTTEQWATIGWDGREGIKGAGNQFHYARRTADDRILWGGYDAVYQRGEIGPQFDGDPVVFGRLAEHFTAVFPTLAGVRFTHGWGGAIDTCSRFIPFWTRAFGGRVISIAGFTGLGVGSSRFAAGVGLAILDGRPHAALSLRMVRKAPVPFPPEPLRSIVIAVTQRSLARADARGGRRDLWLRLLDRLGIGFDS